MSMRSDVDTILLERTRITRRAGVDAEMVVGFYEIFQITGGPVKISSMYGIVVGPVGGVIAGAATPLINFTPAAGIGALAPLCVLAASINGNAEGTIYTWDGSLTALVGVLAPTAVVGIMTPAEYSWSDETTPLGGIGSFILVPGVIRITNAGAAVTDGIIDWYVEWKPCILGAQVSVL